MTSPALWQTGAVVDNKMFRMSDMLASCRNGQWSVVKDHIGDIGPIRLTTTDISDSETFPTVLA